MIRSIFAFSWKWIGRFRPFALPLGFPRVVSLCIFVVAFSSGSLQARPMVDGPSITGPGDPDSLSIHPVHSRTVNGLDYYFIEAGSGPTIFLLHGFPDMANTWDETISELSQDYHVVAPFLRGYYPTGMPEDGNYSVKAIAGDIVALAEALEVDTYTVIGQDWGASITYSVALLAPTKVDRVITIAIPPPPCFKLTPQIAWFGRHFLLFRNKGYALRYTRKQDFRYIDRLYRRWSPDYADYQQSSAAIKATFKYPGRLEAALGYYWSFFEDRDKPDLKDFYAQTPPVPVLFLGGANDNGVDPKAVACIQDSLPQGSKGIVFEHAGHFLHREIPEQFLAEVKAFLAQDF